MYSFDKTPGRTYFEDGIAHFVSEGNPKEIVDFLTASEWEEDEKTVSQQGAWVNQIHLLKNALKGKNGYIIFEYSIISLNKRIDVVLLMDGIVYSLEFKNNETEFTREDMNQADGYGYALKTFHQESKDRYVAPILIATRARDEDCSSSSDLGFDKLFTLFNANPKKMMDYINAIQEKYGEKKEYTIEDFKKWIRSPIKANPTIIESARQIYSNHQVEELYQFDAGKENLAITEEAVNEIVKEAKRDKKKIICFVTGVPGAGKTLVGLDLAGKSRNHKNEGLPEAIFFSGNGPLIKVLTNALGKDAFARHPERYSSEYRAVDAVKSFIQDLHAYKRELISSSNQIPDENVLIFDEAQRVWDQEKLSSWFAKQKNGLQYRDASESDLLLNILKDKEWGVIVALVGLGQDIYTGENGIRTWFDSLLKKFTEWEIRFSDEIFSQSADQLSDLQDTILALKRVKVVDGLHLKTAIRSPRAQNISDFVEAVLNNQPERAVKAMERFDNYPIFITRDLNKAKQWARQNRRRKEHCGMLYSSNGKTMRRIMPGINNFYIHRWFLDQDGKDSSNALEYAASEFDVQGLELDWGLLGWDMDMFFDGKQWHEQRMLSDRFYKESSENDKKHILNSYRVLMTRARKGLVIYVPLTGDRDDLYHVNRYYDFTYRYLKSCGIKDLDEVPNSKPIRNAVELPF